tara:strand:+ start:681 stop:1037 length:357 start_codon:yes stop_codon:yes gene_type:complete
MADNGFAKAQADYEAQMPPEDDIAPFPTRVLRAVVYLTHDGYVPQYEDDQSIEESMSPSMMEQDLKRVLSVKDSVGGLKLNRMAYAADNIEVVDAEWMSPEEADNYGVLAEVAAPGGA